ncbi:MAG: TIGR04372 family glycosyltransferase [SAR86 cluster bacterium]|nr:TIGR04372 family glycosyltransferase [SAR86 cluster bacterium]
MNKYKIYKLINSFWAIPIVLAIRILAPFYKIEMLSINSDRIGHFVADTVQQVLHKKNNDPKRVFLTSWQEPSINSFWSIYISRFLKSASFARYIYYWNTKIPGGLSHIKENSLWSRDKHGNLENSKFKFTLDEQDNQKGEAWLKSKGWDGVSPYVCLLVRDSAYLDSLESHENVDWQYHGYRDSNIEDYRLAVEWLTSQGVWVLRMGKKMKEPLLIKNNKFIDYAFLEDKSDFLDIWLFGTCDLCISSLAGVDYVSDTFRRPLLILNYLPVVDAISWSDAINVPKNLIWKSSRKKLTLRESINNNHLQSQLYKDHGIEVVSLSANEILASVKESWNAIKGRPNEKVLTENDRTKFWEIMRTEETKSVSVLKDTKHNWIHPKSRVGADWLSKMDEDYLT